MSIQIVVFTWREWVRERRWYFCESGCLNLCNPLKNICLPAYVKNVVASHCSYFYLLFATYVLTRPKIFPPSSWLFQPRRCTVSIARHDSYIRLKDVTVWRLLLNKLCIIYLHGTNKHNIWKSNWKLQYFSKLFLLVNVKGNCTPSPWVGLNMDTADDDVITILPSIYLQVLVSIDGVVWCR